MKTDGQRKVFSVAELTRLISGTLEREIGHVWLEGELSNVMRPSSGHYYLKIKDETSIIDGVLFRGNQRTLTFQPANGIKVRVFGEISVYERKGNYQIIIRQMEEGGKGALQERFEKLKKKLKEEGLFDADRKQPLPVLPQHVGVVTSPTGAAIRDILNVITRRFPNLHIVIVPVKVQGEGAAEEIASAIDLLNDKGGLDALIVGRGGGSLEDLWCFNEEIVARAVARSRIPVISAVGHEIDFTISDFVADVRAPTPSAAAEIVVGTKDAFQERLVALGQRLERQVRERLLRARGRFEAVAGHYVFREPANLADRYRQRIQGLGLRMNYEVSRCRRETLQRLDDVSLRMAHSVALWRQDTANRLNRVETQLRSLNPLAVIQRGYSITRDADGNVVRRAADLVTGQHVRTIVMEGEFESEVIEGSSESRKEQGA
ncbi:MAG: exodeoxyribonuclease VII large subunit [Kiritimatiellia bacterium]|jgi:exodeoxyribonuclease VII large subunit|nr:exodeoxyribonuclease VII large subunit [Kiritimatiellia bacterium]